MVAERDLFLPKHPELEKIPNLHVIKALQVSQSVCRTEVIIKLKYNTEYNELYLSEASSGLDCLFDPGCTVPHVQRIIDLNTNLLFCNARRVDLFGR